MAKAILQLKEITKDYKVADTSVHALKGISLAFRAKEFVSVLGPSGCGKTTLLNIIGGLDQYTSGDLVIKGVSTKDYKDGDWDAYRNHSIGFVFQSYNLIPHQTVLGNVELALTLSGVSPQERKRRAEQALERVGLGKELNKKPNQLSGGQMQRVAIARALVNNPEILLADEPTGALDTETSVQIMDLIKEIAGERLVIMVTHNPELAKRYSTRIVELKDGLVVGDSDPFEISECDKNPEDVSEKTDKKTKKAKQKKTSMSFWTAFLLSGRNLLTKKGRTAVTSIAGSIGIISVCLVLALSTGFSNYIAKTEEDMLSYYPVEISETSLDLTKAMTSFMSGEGDDLQVDKIEDKVYVNSFLSQLAQGMMTSNDLSSANTANMGGSQMTYLQYIENMPENLYNAIVYGYGVSLTNNLFTNVSIGSEQTGFELPEMSMSLGSIREYYTYILTEMATEYASMTQFVHYFTNVVNVMPGTSDFSDESYGKYVLKQYDLIGEFPSAANQAVLVIGDENDMTDLTLAQLGFLNEQDFLDLFLNAQDGSDGEDVISFPFFDTTDENGNFVEGVIGHTYTLYYNDAVYTSSSVPGYEYMYQGYKEASDTPVSAEDGIEIEVVGLLRLKDGLTYGCLESGLNLTEKLIQDYIAVNMQSDIVRYLNETENVSVTTTAGAITIANYLAGQQDPSRLQVTPVFGTSSDGGYTSVESVVRSLGGDNTPNSLSIYARNFDTKEEMLAYLDAWNSAVEAERTAYFEANGEYTGYAGPTEVSYTDTVGILMGMVQTILDAITYVLIAFTGISLIVSTVMIGVITYVSVVERTKEIGILRSIGARKKDIKHVFNAETFIIGLCSGLIGVGIAYILQVIINLVLTPLTGISGLAALPLVGAFIMIVISVVLTLISGLVPASAAAKRDPVVALRTE